MYLMHASEQDKNPQSEPLELVKIQRNDIFYNARISCHDEQFLYVWVESVKLTITASVY